MVIVRESPNAKQPSKQPHWPPRSPYETQLLSPNRQRQIRQLQRDLSPSPTPRKRLAPSSSSQTMAAEDDEEDEETVQLQLQAIEARLKLKRIQAAKAKAAGKAPEGSYPSPIRRQVRPRSPDPQRDDVQVPFSPIRKRQPTPEQKSPARVILGIDKGLRAQDISLKRAANARENTSRFTSNRNRTETVAPAPKIKSFSERIAESRLSTKEQKERDERIQQSRSRGFGLAEAGDIFNSPRTISRQTGSSRASSKVDLPPDSSKRSEDEVPRRREAFPRSESRQADSSRTSSRDSMRPPSSRQTNDAPSQSITTESSFKDTTRLSVRAEVQDAASSEASKSSTHTSDLPEATSKFESFSGLHLTKRTTDHTNLTRALHGKEIYTLPRLLKEVKSPNYDPPDCEMDYVVMGIICYKTAPHDHKNKPQAINSAGEDSGSKPKFMVLRLTDLKWDIDLFLFDTGFDQFWKMTEGTVIAVLNPGIMPPRVRESGAFSLKVTSCEDTIIEIGTAQDMSFCTSIKADGKQCTQWVDNRRTDICEYHLSLQVDKARKGRMQFNTMTGFGGRGNATGGRGRGRGRGRGGDVKEEGKYHDRFLHETMYLAPKEFGLSAATLLDEKSAAQKSDKEAKEARQKRRRDLEKEAELAKQLGMKGNGAGSDYLTHQSRKFFEKKGIKEVGAPRPELAFSTNVLSGGTDERPDAKALGLLSNTAETVSLEPVKGRKRGFNLSSAKSHEAMGWSGAFKRGVLERPPSPEVAENGQTKLAYHRERSPSKSSLKTPSISGEGSDVQESPRKKARLMLPIKGLRIPGRESLGGVTPGDIFLSDDDE